MCTLAPHSPARRPSEQGADEARRVKPNVRDPHLWKDTIRLAREQAHEGQKP